MASSIRPLCYDQVKHLLPPRSADSHKGHYGHVLVVGGDAGMGGAALMAAEAAARTGAGLTSVATHPAHAGSFLVRRPELMVAGLSEFHLIDSLGARATTLVLGPGLGRSAWSEAAFTHTLALAAKAQLPLVLDADGLNLLAALPSAPPSATPGLWLLTPHAGEAARLLGSTRAAVEADRAGAVRALQARYGGVALLKGPGTLVCYPRGARQTVECCQHGNPGMATGGMGDVLSGILGGLLAQGMTLDAAARLGVCLHSKAADLAAAADGERGLLATDLFPFLRALLNP
ncbi:MAG: NAD(P)H-hydrate dehydratase [Pseudomonadales bacterium]|jgi:NAD(P)H-hydrate epimerase|nr:NAD(P)H-hydrate dehydratase [Pseudomonadales bacterium]